MNKRKKRLLAGGIGLALLVTVCAVVLSRMLPWAETMEVSAKGGTAWANNKQVGLRVTPGAVSVPTKVVMQKGASRPKAPADAWMEQIGDAADIRPDHLLPGEGKTQVLFTVPASVPSNVDCSKPDPKRQRSICNAGIEVYNTEMQGWVPLETHIENGNTLVADAPHFSEYRPVWTKIGTYTANFAHEVKVELTGETTPYNAWAQAASAFFSQMWGNLTGELDEGKVKPCKTSADPNYSVDFQAPNPNVQACVTRQGNETKLLVADGLALPLAFTTDTVAGITPESGKEAELTTTLRNLIATKIQGGNTLIVSGLDVGNFIIDGDKLTDNNGAPISSIKLTSSISWAAVAGDYLNAMLEFFFPEERVAKQVGKLVDTANCMATGFQKLPEMAHGEVPGALADILKNCLMSAGMAAGLLQNIGVPEAANVFVKELKLIPESFQVGKAISFKLRTGQGLGDSAFTVTNPLLALQGHWINQCAGRNDAADFLFQGDDSWAEIALGPDNNVVSSYQTHFQVQTIKGEPVMVVKSTNQPGLKAGDKLPITLFPKQQGYAAMLEIANNEDWMLYRDEPGASYC